MEKILYYNLSESFFVRKNKMTSGIPGVDHLKGILSASECLSYFAAFKEQIPWQTVKWGPNNLPRLVCNYSAAVAEQKRELSEMMGFLKADVERLFEVNVQSIWCNYYRSGDDWTPPHADEYGNVWVITVSLGATRDCVFQHNETGQKTTYPLENSDILVFSPAINQTYKHSIPKLSGSGAAERISIVFFTSQPGHRTSPAPVVVPSAPPMTPPNSIAHPVHTLGNPLFGPPSIGQPPWMAAIGTTMQQPLENWEVCDNCGKADCLCEDVPDDDYDD
jgi:alkylated DNA repair dioxygenase AlkB